MSNPLNTVGTAPTSPTADSSAKFEFSWKRLWMYCGPGFLMSVAYLDPGNIEADLQAGSTTGYTLLWVLLWATIMGLVLQTMSARIGCVTGKHLAELCAEEFSRPVRILLWLMAEVAIICVDCQEVIGTAVAVQILSNGYIPLWVGVLLTAVYTLTFLLMDKCFRKLEMVFGLLITVMCVTFGAQYLSYLPPQGDVIEGTVVPRLPSSDVSTAVGLIGAVIMPHNLYLHSALVLSRDIDRTDGVSLKESVIYNNIESTIALVVSFVINLFVVAVFANCRDTDFDGATVGLGNAGFYLSKCHTNSEAEKYIFAVGLLASGQAATVTSTYAGQYVMQGYIQIELPAWKRALLSRMIAIGPGLVLGIYASDHADAMQQWLNVVQSIQLPFAVLPLLYFAGSKAVLGTWANSKTLQRVGWAITAVIILANIYLVVTLIAQNISDESGPVLFLIILCLIAFTIGYIALVSWLFLGAVGWLSFKPSDYREVVPLVPFPAEHDSDLDDCSEWLDAEGVNSVGGPGMSSLRADVSDDGESVVEGV